MIVDHSAAASCRRERCRRFPGIRLWVVDIVQLDYIGVFRRTPADDVNLAVHNNHACVVAGRGQRRGLAPFPRRGIVDLMRTDGDLVKAAPADDVDFAINHRQADRATRAAEWRKWPPLVRRHIVFESEIERPGMGDADKAPDCIELPVGPGNTGVARFVGDGRAFAPTIRGRVVFRVELRSLFAVRFAADDVDLASQRDDAYFKAFGGKRCLRRPAPLWSRRLGMRQSGG